MITQQYGNWMYVSGVGNDPRDRKFNTQLQAERYDAVKNRGCQPGILIDGCEKQVSQ